jgi:hypothetical protein
MLLVLLGFRRAIERGKLRQHKKCHGFFFSIIIAIITA